MAGPEDREKMTRKEYWCSRDKVALNQTPPLSLHA